MTESTPPSAPPPVGENKTPLDNLKTILSKVDDPAHPQEAASAQEAGDPSVPRVKMEELIDLLKKHPQVYLSWEELKAVAVPLVGNLEPPARNNTNK